MIDPRCGTRKDFLSAGRRLHFSRRHAPDREHRDRSVASVSVASRTHLLGMLVRAGAVPR